MGTNEETVVGTAELMESAVMGDLGIVRFPG